MPKTLVACIGNIFLGDDAFGCAVARVLMNRRLSPDVRVVDYGIRGLDLVYALLEDWEQVIFVDAVSSGEPPGTLYVIEPEIPRTGPPPTALDAHQMDPARVLRLARALGAKLPNLWLVGCEPSPPIDDELPSGLSLAVESALTRAADLVESLLAGQPESFGNAFPSETPSGLPA